MTKEQHDSSTVPRTTSQRKEKSVLLGATTRPLASACFSHVTNTHCITHAKSILSSGLDSKAQIAPNLQMAEKFEEYLCENTEKELQGIRRLVHTSK